MPRRGVYLSNTICGWRRDGGRTTKPGVVCAREERIFEEPVGQMEAGGIRRDRGDRAGVCVLPRDEGSSIEHGQRDQPRFPSALRPQCTLKLLPWIFLAKIDRSSVRRTERRSHADLRICLRRLRRALRAHRNESEDGGDVPEVRELEEDDSALRVFGAWKRQIERRVRLLRREIRTRAAVRGRLLRRRLRLPLGERPALPPGNSPRTQTASDFF